MQTAITCHPIWCNNLLLEWHTCCLLVRPFNIQLKTLKEDTSQDWVPPAGLTVLAALWLLPILDNWYYFYDLSPPSPLPRSILYRTTQSNSKVVSDKTLSVWSMEYLYIQHCIPMCGGGVFDISQMPDQPDTWHNIVISLSPVTGSRYSTTPFLYQPGGISGYNACWTYFHWKMSF